MNITFSIFPKFYAHLNPHELAALVKEVGLDTTNAVIRDGYWVTPSGLASEMPLFVKAMNQEGLDVTFATAGFSPHEIVSNPDILSILADNGIKQFRMSYFTCRDGDVRRSMESARIELEEMVPVCEKYGVKAVYQVHHRTLVPSGSAAWELVNGLPHEWIGVELDPGNQSFEGYESWHRSVNLLGDYMCAAGIKDSAIVRDPSKADKPTKGWVRDWVPLYEGVTNWYEFITALKNADFNGTFVFMPFYDENNPEAMTAKLKQEVAYLRKVVAEKE